MMRSRTALQRYARRQTLGSLLMRIRAQEPDLSASSDEELLLSFMEKSLDELLTAEDNFDESSAAEGIAPPNASPLMWDALTFTATLPTAVYALTAMKAEVRLEFAEDDIDDLLDEVDGLKVKLDEANEVIQQYKDRELHIQQILDEAGINVDIINRMSTDIASRSVELHNRLN